MSFNISFKHDNDTVYFAHSYPYTYSDLQDYLMAIQRHPVKSKYCKLRLLCRSLAGNNVYYLTVTAPPTPPQQSTTTAGATTTDGISADDAPNNAPAGNNEKGGSPPSAKVSLFKNSRRKSSELH